MQSIWLTKGSIAAAIDQLPPTTQERSRAKTAAPFLTNFHLQSQSQYAILAASYGLRVDRTKNGEKRATTAHKCLDTCNERRAPFLTPHELEFLPNAAKYLSSS